MSVLEPEGGLDAIMEGMAAPLQIPKGMEPIIVYDLDSTICDTTHRAWYADKASKGEGTWDEYSMMCADDLPLVGTVRLAQITSWIYPNFLLTAREAKAEELTKAWLAKHDVPYNRLRMHHPNEVMHGEFKVKVLREWREEGYEPILVVEDWPSIATAIEAEGIPVLCVNPRYPDTPGAVANNY